VPVKSAPVAAARGARAGAAARFDAAYFRQFYGDPATRVADTADAARLAGLVVGISHYFGLRVTRILDAGCGTGLMRGPLAAGFPTASYTGLEYSDFLCERHGWQRGSVVDYASKRPFDLVICHDVVQYLTDAQAARAIGNLARLCRGMLSFSVPTRLDWRTAADPVRSDPDVHRRTGEWYRRRLRRHFRHLGCGVHVIRELKPVAWELEEPWS
jgi:SAM-dependent methyltransferase